MPSANASARCAASKLVTPIAPIRPFLLAAAPSRAAHRARPDARSVHQWNCSRSTLVDAEPVEPFVHARARTISAVIGPGCGHHLVKAIGRSARPRIAAEQPAGDQFGAAVMVGHVEGVEAGLGIGGQRVGAALGVEQRAALLDIGHLPEPADQAADRQARRARRGQALAVIVVPSLAARRSRGGAPTWRDTTRILAEQAARPQQAGSAQSATPIMTICSAAARACWPAGNSAAISAADSGPDAPDEHRAEDGAAIVAGAADDQHRPDLEGERRQVIVRAR